MKALEQGIYAKRLVLRGYAEWSCATDAQTEFPPSTASTNAIQTDDVPPSANLARPAAGHEETTSPSRPVVPPAPISRDVARACRRLHRPVEVDSDICASQKL